MVSIKKEKQPSFKLGGSKKMDDTSSEEESVSGDDEDKKLLGYAKLGDENSDDAESVLQEDPLNSDDDASSENEDTEVYDNVPNIVICQFEKVGRTGKKWNFNLSEGVMSIKGKDYCFHKSTGDADW
uniref:Uncharacterized protein n=1 Tax=Ditylenchus dipsaci TaxID=166011 RepID=A0A915D7A0_9BILA